MSTKYNEEAEDLMFELFDEDDFTKVISFVDKYGCDFVDRDGRNLLMNFIVEGKSTFAIELIKQYKMNGLNLDLQDDSGWTALHFAAQENKPGNYRTSCRVKGKLKYPRRKWSYPAIHCHF